MFRNSPTHFGLISKLLHWGIALLIFAQVGLGLYLTNIKIHYTQIYLYNWHKSLGALTLAAIMIRLIWHLTTRPPAPHGIGWQKRAAQVVHKFIYALLLIVPLTGWIASSAAGIEMSFFGLFPIPFIAPIHEPTEAWFFLAHSIATRLLIVTIVLHIIAAVQRQWIKKDGTLRRMWF